MNKKILIWFGILVIFSYFVLAEINPLSDQGIEIKKIVSSNVYENNFIQIKIIVENMGSMEFKNLIITDSFLTDNFIGGSPPEEFIIADNFLSWKKEFNLNPSEVKTFEYSVKVRDTSRSVKLKPTLLILDSELIATSNEAFVLGAFCGNDYCDYNEDLENCALDCFKEEELKKRNYAFFFILLGILIILFVSILIFYKIKNRKIYK